MSLLRFHLDEDCQSAALAAALRQHGLEVSTTNEADIFLPRAALPQWQHSFAVNAVTFAVADDRGRR